VIPVLLSTAFAAGPVVAIGNGLVAAPPAEIEATEPVSGAWVSVVGDCLEEGRPGAFAVVDRSAHGATASALLADTAGVRALGPSAVVVGVGAQEMRADGPSAEFVAAVGKLVASLRADGGPAVLLVGMVAPTLEQLEWNEPVEPRQAAIDARTTEWNAGLAGLASADDGVWFVDLWSAWPRDGRSRRRLTRGGWGLTDPAHARIGAEICEELLKKLKSTSP
jgi:hypothetical protein